METASEMSAMEMELQVLILQHSLFLSLADVYVVSSPNHRLDDKTPAFSPGSDHNHLQVLVNIAQEISRQGIKPGTRKINGRYIHSHLATRLEGEHPALNQRLVGCANYRT